MTPNERRFLVEITDDYGRCDYDFYESVVDAIEYAERLDPSAKAQVIDRQDQSIVWTHDEGLTAFFQRQSKAALDAKEIDARGMVQEADGRILYARRRASQ